MDEAPRRRSRTTARASTSAPGEFLQRAPFLAYHSERLGGANMPGTAKSCGERYPPTYTSEPVSKEAMA